jgi:hypothetical protein
MASPVPPASLEPRRPSAVELQLAALNPDELTPREALQRLYELHKAALESDH